MIIGRIYKIICDDTNECYIGSTTQTLTQRLQGHRSEYKSDKVTTSSAQIIARGNFHIELIEEMVCDTIPELHKREGYWQKRTTCINKYIAGRSSKEYYQDNKEEIRKKRCPAYHSKWYYANKGRWKGYAATASVRKKEKVTCECGRELTRGALRKHRQSQFHILRSSEYPLGFLALIL
jgi:hypothetical protein